MPRPPGPRSLPFVDVALLGSTATVAALLLAVVAIVASSAHPRRAAVGGAATVGTAASVGTAAPVGTATPVGAATSLGGAALVGSAALTTVAVGALGWALLTGDFRLAYVAETATRSATAPSRLAALWGGMDGSLLFFTWLLVVGAVVGLHLGRRAVPALAPVATAVAALVVAGLLAASAFVADPFTRLALPAIDGAGLVPILERPAMLYHPPLLYAGLTATVVPFAFAVAGMWQGGTDGAWLRVVRRSTGVAWVVLTLGMAAGAHWAYGELGWGGFWAWDPIENTSLLPWLAATALLHACLVDEHRARRPARLSTAVLATVPFACVVVGAVLTRSGAASSVHAFGSAAAVGRALLVLVTVVVVIVMAATARAWRRDGPGPRWRWSPRRAVLAANAVILLGAGLVVATGTLHPLLAQGGRATVAGTFFARLTGPLALLALALVGVGPHLRWSRGVAPVLRARVPWASAMGVAVLAGGFATDVGPLFALLALALAGSSVTLLVLELRSRLRTGGPWRFRRRAVGASLAHLGVTVLLVGVAGSTATTATTALLRRGGTASVAGYTLRHAGTTVDEADGRRRVAVHLEVLHDGELVARLAPGQTVFTERALVRADPVLRSTPAEDVQVVLRRLDGDGTALVDVAVRPLVVWVWAGALLMALGGGMAVAGVAPAGERVRRPSPAIAGSAP